MGKPDDIPQDVWEAAEVAERKIYAAPSRVEVIARAILAERNVGRQRKTAAAFTYYTTVELARAATAPKLSTKTRIAMLDEINRRDAAEAGQDRENG